MMDNPVTVVFILEILTCTAGVLTPKGDRIRQQLNKASLIFKCDELVFSKIGCSSMTRKFDLPLSRNYLLACCDNKKISTN